MWGVQTHCVAPVFLVPFHKDLARMNGTPQPNQKWLPALGIKPGSLDHESQPLTIGPLLTPDIQSLLSFARCNPFKYSFFSVVNPTPELGITSTIAELNSGSTTVVTKPSNIIQGKYIVHSSWSLVVDLHVCTYIRFIVSLSSSVSVNWFSVLRTQIKGHLKFCIS